MILWWKCIVSEDNESNSGRGGDHRILRISETADFAETAQCDRIPLEIESLKFRSIREQMGGEKSLHKVDCFSFEITEF